MSEQPEVKFAASCFHFVRSQSEVQCMIFLLEGDFSDEQFAIWTIEFARGQRTRVNAEIRTVLMCREDVDAEVHQKVREARMLTEAEYYDILRDVEGN